MVNIKTESDTSYHKQVKVPPTAANGSSQVVDITQTFRHAYSFDFMELALLIVGILMLIQLSKVRGIFYYVSLTLQDLIDVLLLLVIIYVVLKIISSIVGAILLYGNEKSISSMVEETNVEQKL